MRTHPIRLTAREGTELWSHLHRPTVVLCWLASAAMAWFAWDLWSFYLGPNDWASQTGFSQAVQVASTAILVALVIGFPFLPFWFGRWVARKLPQPTTYFFDDAGIHEESTAAKGFVAWSAFGRVEALRHGLLVRNLPHQTLAVVYVPWRAVEDRGKFLDLVRSRVRVKA